MNKSLIVLTGNNSFFGQTRKPWTSIDYNKMESEIEKHGYKVHHYAFHEIFNKKIHISDSTIFYTFSQKPELIRYILDTLLYLKDFNNKLIPNLELLRCHENKGYQELYKSKLGIKSLPSFYFSNLRDLESYELSYPIVLKTVDGSNSKGVFLIKDKDDLYLRVKAFEQIGFFDVMDLIRRKYFRKHKKYVEYPSYSNRKDYYEYKDYIRPNKRFILQQFVPDLKCDYRVLILFDRYYITKRHVKDNDFRASGAKKFDFNFEPSEEVMAFSREIYQKFDTPFLSIDLAYDGIECHLLEYQALHFGLNVLVKSKGYYTFSEGVWSFTEKRPNIEKDLIRGLIKHLGEKETS
jgi:glutathione synthase/RimK-type ligase-like ATP-grasp enzyme